jgi:homoserine acetyltransferase
VRVTIHSTATRSSIGLGAALAALLLANAPATSAHWPDQPPHQMAYLGDFSLERGRVIENLKISYVTHGKLNAAKDNAILFMHGFGTSAASRCMNSSGDITIWVVASR